MLCPLAFEKLPGRPAPDATAQGDPRHQPLGCPAAAAALAVVPTAVLAAGPAAVLPAGPAAAHPLHHGPGQDENWASHNSSGRTLLPTPQKNLCCQALSQGRKNCVPDQPRHQEVLRWRKKRLGAGPVKSSRPGQMGTKCAASKAQRIRLLCGETKGSRSLLPCGAA